MTKFDQENLTFRALVERISNDDGLPPHKRHDVASGLRSFVKKMHLPIDTPVPPAPELRKMIAGVTPLMLGIKRPGTWKNIRGHLQFALAHVGLATVPRRYSQKPSARWEQLLKPLVYGERYKLSHIARYCTTINIEPEQLDDAVMARLLEDLRDRSLKAEPERVHRDATVMWNRLANADPAWPQQRLAVVDNRDCYSLPWESFPEPLRQDIEAWLAHLAGADPFKPRNFSPLRPASLKTRKNQLRLYLSALVLSGVDPALLVSLKAAVTLERAKIGFMFFWKRAGQQPSHHASQIAGMVLSIARHWAKLPKKSIEAIKESAFTLRVEQSGMTEKNQARLRPLNDPQRALEYAGLTEKLAGEVYAAGPPTRTLAVQLQTILAVEILSLMPMRIGNLQQLRLDRHLIYGRRRHDVTISIPTRSVKNRQSLEYIVPEPAAELLERYLRDYRPLLDNPDSPWLFSGQRLGQPKCYETMRQQIMRIMRNRGGFDFRPHTFRHATGLIILTENPAAYGQVQRVLAHKNSNTTMNFYTGMERLASVAHFDKTMLAMREKAAASRNVRPYTKPRPELTKTPRVTTTTKKED